MSGKRGKQGELSVPDARSTDVAERRGVVHAGTSPDQQQIASAMFRQTLQMLALPAPETLAAYNAIDPELGKWFMAAADEERKQRHDLEQKQAADRAALIAGRVWRVKWGLAAATFVAALFLVAVMVGRLTPGVPWWAPISFGMPIAAIVAALARMDSSGPVVRPKPQADETPKK